MDSGACVSAPPRRICNCVRQVQSDRESAIGVVVRVPVAIRARLTEHPSTAYRLLHFLPQLDPPLHNNSTLTTPPPDPTKTTHQIITMAPIQAGEKFPSDVKFE